MLGDTAQVVGGVIAEDIVVRGRVVGSIRGLRVTLQAQSYIEGDIIHQSLAIEQGAIDFRANTIDFEIPGRKATKKRRGVCRIPDELLPHPSKRPSAEVLTSAQCSKSRPLP